MKFADIQQNSRAELERSLVEEQSALHALSLKARSQTLKQVHKIKAARRRLAQIMTALRSKRKGD